MNVELLRDGERPDGWWLLVDGSEQSYVSLDSPTHLEFEYVQHIAVLVDTWRPGPAPLRALHLGGGLCTVPRWVAARHPGSRQWVAEASTEIARLARALPLPRGVTVTVTDARRWLADPNRPAPGGVDLCVVDLYDGPATVVVAFGLDGLRAIADRLRPGGLFVANLSDAAPFRLSRTVAAGALAVWPWVAVVAEPPVLRGRRSGNLVLAGSGHPLDEARLSRRYAAAAVRGRLLTGTALRDWIGNAVPAATAAALPDSGERAGPGLD